ncbi:phenylacetic acid degradation bifunctional protein PaaZ [Mycolicibacterium pulveris]|uniref:Putative phenylacetic acid degradation protein PaaN n=1 Tax=Mycolicibacterium pulveris TaxID=36813 RepID=A0A7I7UNY1_MYCPV|nr:phenylacetic acid degradation bifunctional protein PaaZ [Mycolicibacterium pulveris]MCV6983287.1 phenylacetic acid degradation bifunctional protein PaaZ [Mycolicibacterium pulveris]BBY83162.1 putative phenylacetic acid degradation protein PaaN [Mycolicibacterium pulveris]
MINTLPSYVCGHWRSATGDTSIVRDAATGDVITRVSAEPLDYDGILDYARNVGGSALRPLTFVERASMLKALAAHLSAKIDDFTEVSLRTGATRRDSAVDIDGGVGVLFVYASKGLKELPDEHVLCDGEFEFVGKSDSFGVQHIMTPLLGASVQINAFNFPVWGFLEKFAPAFLAGVPSVVKPARQTAYLTEMVVREIVASELVPEGALQLVCAAPDGLLDSLTGQDVLGVTGSHATATALRNHPSVIGRGVRFSAEADSLNSSVLGADVSVNSPEFDIFVRALVKEMTQKAGQKCTAIRRAFVPRALIDEVEQAATGRLSAAIVGDPRDGTVTMGPLVSQGQRDDVRRAVAKLANAGRLVFGSIDPVMGQFSSTADLERGAYLAPVLLRFDDAAVATAHSIEAFGPVASLLPYDDLGDAISNVARGEGSLVASVVTADADIASAAVAGLAPWHGRLLVVNRDNAVDSTGHGAAIPHAVHGGPGRAGGGEELGGLRSLPRYLQRTAVQTGPGFVDRIWRR